MNSEDTLSVAEARALMPSMTATMSDDDITRLLDSLNLLASAIIEAVQFDDEFRVNIAYNRGQ
jgi:hypothetical protein